MLDTDVQPTGPPTPLSDSMRDADRTSVKFLWDTAQMATGVFGGDYRSVFGCSNGTACDTLADFPGENVHSELKLQKVVDELQKVPEREAKGEIRRLGDLGYLILNNLLWKDDWKTFPLGADVVDHRKLRPELDAAMGSNSRAWTNSMIRESAIEFFQTHQRIDKRAINIWITKLFHKILLNMDLSESQAELFEAYKSNAMTISIIPQTIGGWLSSLLFKKARKMRNFWLEQYQSALKSDSRKIFSISGMDRRELRYLADMLLTSMTSAGGLSVPSVIQLALAVKYAGDNSPWKGDRRLTEQNIEQFVFETIRRYPVVVGFPWWTPDQKHRTVMNLAMALNDESVWDEPETFKLRSNYASNAGSGTLIGVAWAQQAKGASFTPDSRGCPGQDLSMVICTEFFRALLPQQADWGVSQMPEGGIKITQYPSKPSDFTLEKYFHDQAHTFQEIPQDHPITNSDAAEFLANENMPQASCILDVQRNYDMAMAYAKDYIDKKFPDAASLTREKLDCQLTKFRSIMYTGLPVLTMWKMQLGTDDMMKDVFEDRRESMRGENGRYDRLYTILKNDAIWSYLYSRYYPEDVQWDLWNSDMTETAKMVTMVVREECIADKRLAKYSKANRDKYYYLASNPVSAATVSGTYIPKCDIKQADFKLMTIKSSREPSKCLAVDTDFFGNVAMAKCDEDDRDQVWWFDGFQLKNNGHDKPQCLAVNSITNNVDVDPCEAANPRQQWSPVGQSLKNMETGYCVDWETWFDNVHAKRCDDSESDQQWLMQEILKNTD